MIGSERYRMHILRINMTTDEIQTSLNDIAQCTMTLTLNKATMEKKNVKTDTLTLNMSNILGPNII